MLIILLVEHQSYSFSEYKLIYVVEFDDAEDSVIVDVFWIICCCGCCCWLFCSFSSCEFCSFFCKWYFLKFSSTSKCVKRLDIVESFEWRVRVILQPSRLSKSVNAFSSLRSHGRWSSWTWYGVTWTWIEMFKRHNVSSRLRAVIHVFFPIFFESFKNLTVIFILKILTKKKILYLQHGLRPNNTFPLFATRASSWNYRLELVSSCSEIHK